MAVLQVQTNLHDYQGINAYCDHQQYWCAYNYQPIALFEGDGDDDDDDDGGYDYAPAA